MYEDIKNNKIKSGIIVSCFILITTLIIYYVCMAFDLGIVSIFIALSVSIISAWVSYYNSDKIILKLNGARPANHEENQKLLNILDALMLSSGLTTKPTLYIIEDSQPNAFATGRTPEHSVICVTTALLEKLDYYELEGVIAHELSHIKNYDILLSCVVSVMVGLIVMLSDIFTRSFFFGRGRKSSKNDGNGILMIIGLIFLVLAPIFGTLMQLAISRRREYLADATAVQFTRNPDGLISALQKLEADSNELQYANQATAHMFISDPFKKNVGNKKKRTNWFSTHPDINSRIEALRNLK